MLINFNLGGYQDFKDEFGRVEIILFKKGTDTPKIEIASSSCNLKSR
jgi:hypothetical protein